MYKKVSTDLNYVQREREITKFWKEREIFEKTNKLRKGAPRFNFYDGPPTANGKPHFGHIITRVMKDVIPRYWTMKGKSVLRKAGWDTHGLPVELEVEKALGISGKPQIEEYGVEGFIKQCKESVWKYKTLWEEMTDKVGYWVDMENPYITYDNNYIESVWWSLKEIYDKDLLYKGHKIVPYCPRCGTSLSSHEVAQGYKDVKETSAIAKFRVKGEENTYILAWTTTPWTLPSNVALCVHEKETYVKVQVENGEKYILAKELVSTVLKDEKVKVLEEYKGKDLENIEYIPLFDFVYADKKAFYVVCDDYVTLTDGTGVVHIAPAFGEDDARVGKKYDLPFVQLVDEQGNFTKEVTMWAGMFVKDGDKEVINELKRTNQLFAALPYEHSYPHCWRCDTPLLYYAIDTWFIEMTKVRDRLVANNQTVNWMPDNIKNGRFGNFLENVVDWGLSRSRYWGTPLPIWECECGHRHVIGSIEELKEHGIDVPDDIELHKPYIDNVYLKCDDCGGKMKRVSEVIDCWYDSGSMPFAQLHYPFENKEEFLENFPAQYISEAIDQTRGWFYTLMAISTVLFDKSPYENVIVLGHVGDKDGIKMSKHKGNVVDPNVVLDKQGADAVRWYFCINSAPWLPTRFSEEGVNETQKKFINTLWNTYAFYVLYADIDQFNPTKYSLEEKDLTEIDRWVLSRLNTVIDTVDNDLENYRITESAKIIADFTEELSNWYVRRCRDRYWQKELNKDKIAAYMTLYTCIVKLCKVSAPFVPFVTEEIYQNLVVGLDKSTPESIHLCDFPKADKKMIDKTLEDKMGKVLEVVTLGRACRNKSGIKNRQVLSTLYVSENVDLEDNFLEIISGEINVKKVEKKADIDKLVSYNVKPNLKTLGPKCGKVLPKIGEKLKELDGTKIVNEMNEKGNYVIELEGTTVVLEKEDLLVETMQSKDFVTDSYGDIIVALDIRLNDELIAEGNVREFISKLQNLRKEMGFEVQNHISLSYMADEYITKILEDNIEQIKDELLADTVEKGNMAEPKEIDINGKTVNVEIKVTK